MSMQRIYLGATVDVAHLKDAYEALSMVDGLEIVTTAPARERRGSRLNREPVRRNAPVKKAGSKYGNPRGKDPRAVSTPTGSWIYRRRYGRWAFPSHNLSLIHI